jgi:hypothetical protein
MGSASGRFGELYRALCFALVAQGVAVEGARAIGPSDCVGGHADSTCANAVYGPTRHSPPPPPPDSYPLAGMPLVNYWYWGYDFATQDTRQLSPPTFVNRSGQSLLVSLSFTIPNPPCGKDCLPGVEFYFDQGFHKVDPQLSISGNTATAVMQVNNGGRYSWVIGLWLARDPVVAVTTLDGIPVPPEIAGLSPRPDVSTSIPGIITTCQCQDALTALCSAGDHYSNGLTGQWSRNVGVYRFNAWSNCPQGGGG